MKVSKKLDSLKIACPTLLFFVRVKYQHFSCKQMSILLICRYEYLCYYITRSPTFTGQCTFESSLVKSSISFCGLSDGAC